METNKVTRVEVIDEKGRSYVNWKKNNVVKLVLQDGGRTLKIFVLQSKMEVPIAVVSCLENSEVG